MARTKQTARKGFSSTSNTSAMDQLRRDLASMKKVKSKASKVGVKQAPKIKKPHRYRPGQSHTQFKVHFVMNPYCVIVCSFLLFYSIASIALTATIILWEILSQGICDPSTFIACM